MSFTEEQYVNLETAKLIKEKGIEFNIHTFYSVEGRFEEHTLVDLDDFHYYAPTQQMMLRYLREEKDIFITVFPECLNNYSIIKYWYKVESFEHGRFWTEYQSEVRLMSYEEAVEAGIQYCLKKGLM